MRRIIIAAFFALAAFAVANGQMKNGKTEDELIKMDKEWTAAELKGDKTAVSRFIADDFWETVEGGDMHNKTQYLATIAPSTDKDVADDYAVRVFGNTAIMTHRGTITGARNFQYRSTHIWMKRGNQWQLVAHQSGEIKPAANP